MDPFAVVVFEDIEPFLVDISWSPPVVHALVDRYLQFLGIVGPQTFVLTQKRGYAQQQQQATSEQAWTIPGDSDDCYATVDGLDIWAIPAGEPMGVADDSASTSGEKQWWRQAGFPFVSVPVSLDTPDTPFAYVHVRPWRKPASKTYRDMARNALGQLPTSLRLDKHSRLQLGVALLESAFLECAESGRQQGRQLLAENPTSLALWNTLAKMHARVGMWGEARRVWAAAISLASTLPDDEQAWVAVVCKSWALLEILHGRGLAAGLGVLAARRDPDALRALAGENAVYAARDCCCSVADLLCAQREVDDFARACRTTRDGGTPPEVPLAVLTLRLWAAYAAGRNVEAAETAFKSHGGVELGEPALLALCSVHLFHAMTSRVYRAADLRERVADALRRFPHTTVFWEMLLFSERRTRIAGQVGRQLAVALADGVLAPDIRLIGVYAERRRAGWQVSGGVRRAMGQATRGSGSASVLMWMAAIALECRLGAPKRAKRVLLTALFRCPWAKPLYMVALGGTLALQFSEHEKQALMRAMVRAGIRTRASLADVSARPAGEDAW
ncbi:hypothetical protein LPJ61_004800 [Coemansia biformis]|uniref:Uncharacterized protein n=1 Tax=Coemansia biformis TaxID=1286918 RepID=A0A9W8CV00_9FUNG|nr:hypothetical protein LPJ61_004800 [Coemansia biformis]